LPVFRWVYPKITGCFRYIPGFMNPDCGLCPALMSTFPPSLAYNVVCTFSERTSHYEGEGAKTIEVDPGKLGRK